MTYEEGDYKVVVRTELNGNWMRPGLYNYPYIVYYKGDRIGNEIDRGEASTEADAVTKASNDIVKHKCALLSLQKSVNS